MSARRIRIENLPTLMAETEEILLVRYSAAHERELTGNSTEWRESTEPLSACSTTAAPIPSARLNQSHEDNHLLSHHHRRRSNTDMKFRNSFSKLKKKVEHRLTRSKTKPNRTGTDAGGESVDSTGSRPGSEPHVVAGSSQDQEGYGANADEGQVISTIRLPQPGEPGPAPACGSVDDQEKSGADVDEGEAERAHSRLHSVDVEVIEGSGPAKGKDTDGEKIKRAGPSPSITSIPHGDKPDST